LNQAYLDWKKERPQKPVNLEMFFKLCGKDCIEVIVEAGEFGFDGNAKENEDS